MILAYGDSDFQNDCISFYATDRDEEVYWVRRNLPEFFTHILFNKKITAIYLGDVRSLKQILLILLMRRSISIKLFDDGLYSIWLIHAITKQKTLTFNWIKDIILRKLVLNRRNIDFYTRFTSEEVFLINGRFKVKKLNYDVDIDPSKKTADFSLVVGSDYTELCILSCDEYRSMLPVVPGKTTLYYPHRKENEDSFKGKIPQSYTIIPRNNMNLMSFLNSATYLPETVYLFYSTAIIEIIEKYPQIKLQILEVNSKSKYSDMLKLIQSELRQKIE